jgi:hypothetical protein
MMPSFSLYNIVSVTLLCATVIVGSATAQTKTRYHVARKPSELFAAFIRERQALNDQTNAGLDLTHVLTYHAQYPPEDVEYLLRELEHFALNGEPQWLRAEAVSKIALPGSNRSAHPTAGTFVRLERVYQRSSDPLVKTAVVSAMGRLTETRQAIAFLERVAMHEPGTFPQAGKGLAALLTMGDQGRLVLKRLHESGAVRDPRAKRDLALLAKRDYRLPEPKK